MADKKLISSSSSCTYNPPSASSSDEISLFLRHIFDRSSPLPSYYSTAATATEINGEQHAEMRSFVSQSSLKRMIPFSAACVGTSAVAAAVSGGDGCFSGNNAPGNSSATRVSSSSIGASGNETDEYDCESEEAVVDEPPAKSGPPRSSSKRCRAAEVHNLSEKRRRSRINEKMKALQSLIPNSNKTDKASMLDEAIEYLKQLQLQVQMLTMRNGLSLHPLCLPGSTLQLPQIRPVESTNESLINHTNQFATNPNPPDLINTATSYTLEPAIRNHFGPFPLLNPSMEMNREEGLNLTQQRLSIGHHNTNLTGETGLFDGQETDLKD